jgi:oligo-1,6-glucosidase
MLATLQFSLSGWTTTQCLRKLQLTDYTGTPFLYQGQEIAMKHPQGWKIEDYKDVETLNFFKEYVE